MTKKLFATTFRAIIGTDNCIILRDDISQSCLKYVNVQTVNLCLNLQIRKQINGNKD